MARVAPEKKLPLISCHYFCLEGYERGVTMKLIDLTGQKFGRLTVIRRGETSKCGQTKWVCKCECGKEKTVDSYNLRHGKSLSCGCLSREITSKTRKVHGLTKTRIHGIWSNMKTRCYNTNDHAFERYGGRGITVCEEWKDDFMSFYNWAMSNGYKDDLSIDRIDNNKGYSPDNCRWATAKEQNNNKRNVYKVTYQGKTQTLSQWAVELNVSHGILLRRFNKGLPLNEVFDTDKYSTFKLITYNGETKNIKQWAETLGIPYKTLYKRISDGWTIKTAFNTPVNPLYKQISYKGKTQTIADWSREYNIPYHTLKHRISRYKWDIEKALKTPIK